MALRKRELTKTEIIKIKALNDDLIFNIEFVGLLEEFRQGDKVKDYLAEMLISGDIPLHKAISVTQLVYEVCNAHSDHELGRDWLSELVVDIEDLVEGIEKLFKKYL